MKTSNKLMLTASLLSVGFASIASADTDVYITGSSAYRAAVTNAIGHLFTANASTDGTNPGTGAVLVSYTQNSANTANVSNANQQLFDGFPTPASGITPLTTRVWIHTDWTGSIAGITALSDNIDPAPPSNTNSYAFLADVTPTGSLTEGSVNTTTGVITNPSGGQSMLINAASVNHLADGAMSDVFQSSTAYTSPALTGANPDSQYGTDGVVGVVPFVFVGNPDFAAYNESGATFNSNANGKIVNITATEANSLFGASQVLSQITGNASDTGTILPIGRNADSGTRLTTFAEVGFNPVGAAPQQPTQYEVVATTATSGSPPVTTITALKIDKYPGETLFPGTPAAQTYASGNSGYSSGGNEAIALSYSGTSTSLVTSGKKAYLVGSLGESDASTVVKNKGVYLDYNGVPYGVVTAYSGTAGSGGVPTTTSYTTGRVALDQGLYTLWGYEHSYYRSDDGSTQTGILDSIAAEVTSTDANITGENIANMAVQRSFEGGPISYVGVGGSSGL